MRTHIVLWKWKPHGEWRSGEYTAEHVEVMCAMLRRNLEGVDARIICVTDDAEGITSCETFPLWENCRELVNATRKHLPSCYRRLKLYDPATQWELGINPGDRVVSLDLDTLVTGPLKSLLSTPGSYVGWELAGQNGRKVFNGSFQMFTAGTLEFIWKAFDPDNSPRDALRAGYLGSDQAWLSWNLATWHQSVSLKYPDVASYPLQTRILGHLAAKTKLIFFHGTTKPWFPEARKQSAWIDRYWRL